MRKIIYVAHTFCPMYLNGIYSTSKKELCKEVGFHTYGIVFCYCVIVCITVCVQCAFIVLCMCVYICVVYSEDFLFNKYHP